MSPLLHVTMLHSDWADISCLLGRRKKREKKNFPHFVWNFPISSHYFHHWISASNSPCIWKKIMWELHSSWHNIRNQLAATSSCCPGRAHQFNTAVWPISHESLQKISPIWLKFLLLLCLSLVLWDLQSSLSKLEIAYVSELCCRMGLIKFYCHSCKHGLIEYIL